MTKQTINLGTNADDGTGDTLRVAGAKMNANFGELYIPAGAGAPITITGTTTAASNQLTGLSSVAGLAISQEITGVGIPAGTTITAIATTSLTLSQNAAASNTTPVTAYPAGTPGIAPASKARSRSRDVLYADGSYAGQAPNPYFYKFDDVRRLRRYRAARGAIMSGRPFRDSGVANTGRTILIFGDSPSVGVEPNIPSWRIAPSYAAASILNTQSAGSHRHSTFTGALLGYQMENAAPGEDRYTAGAGWFTGNNFPGLPAIMSNSTNSADLIITDPVAWDRANIVYRSATPGDQFTYKIGTESAVTVTQAGADRMVSLNISAAANQVQPLKINRVSGSINLAYVEFYSSAQFQFRWVNLGVGGGSIAGNAGLVNQTFSGIQSPANLNTIFNPALVILHYGYEIAGQRSNPPSGTGPSAAVAVSNWVTAMNTAISTWKGLGVDVLLVSMHPWDDVNLYKDQASVLQAREAFYAVCDANDVPGIDNFAAWGSWSEAVATGFIVHYARPLPAGAWDLGYRTAQALIGI